MAGRGWRDTGAVAIAAWYRLHPVPLPPPREPAAQNVQALKTTELAENPKAALPIERKSSAGSSHAEASAPPVPAGPAPQARERSSEKKPGGEPSQAKVPAEQTGKPQVKINPQDGLD